TNPASDVGRMDERGSSPTVGPGWVISDFELPGITSFSLTLRIEGSGDDDMVGFVFARADGEHFYQVDWKRTTQTYTWGDPVPGGAAGSSTPTTPLMSSLDRATSSSASTASRSSMSVTARSRAAASASSASARTTWSSSTSSRTSAGRTGTATGR